MKRVLFVAYYFPPAAASGAMRPLGFCRNLPAYGWQPQVLTTTSDCVYPLHPVDAKLGDRVPKTVPVFRAPYKDRLQQLLDVRQWVRGICSGNSKTGSASRSAAPQATAEPRGSPARGSVKEWVLDWVFAFPDRQCGWYGPALAELPKIRAAGIPDVIMATGGPWTNFLVGRAVAERLNRPLVLDYRDPWNCNPYYSFSTPSLTAKSSKAETDAWAAAAHVIANTEELRDRLIQEFGHLHHRCTWIPNGFDRDLFAGIATDDKRAAHTSNDGYELCHFGTVYGKRTPRVLLQAILELFRDGRLKPNDIRLRFVGGWDSTDQECERYAVELEQHGFLRRLPSMAHNECLRAMQAASVLLVLQPDSPLQVPAKIYEYVATGRPLLLIGGEGATANLVERHALGISCPNKLEQIKSTLTALATGQQQLRPPDAARVDRFDYRALTGELAGLLDQTAQRVPHG